MKKTGERAVVLLSGGLDSSTCMAIASSEGYQCYALSINYGQRNARELESAKRVAGAFSAIEHLVVDLNLTKIGGSALTAPLAIPKSTDGIEPASSSEVPITYVPARNSIFITLGAAWADALEADHIFIGVNQVDFSGYPDCRPPFIHAMQQTLRLGTRRANLQLHTPLMDLTKGEIIRRGIALGVNYAHTWSCYDPQNGKPCGLCDSCVHRKKGFLEIGLADPAINEAGGCNP